jgi:hypothetical protein
MVIKPIRDGILESKYRISDHAVKQMIKRSITRLEIEEAVINGEIIEEYPDDKYSPSCLIYGRTKTEKDLHVQLSLPPSIIVITTYDSDPEEWINCKIRR